MPLATNQGFKNIVIKDSGRILVEYVAFVLTKLVPTMETWASGGTFKEISKSKFVELQIPLPPLEVQREIVAEIVGYQRVIDGARAVVDNYRPRVAVDLAWPMVALGEVCKINPRKSQLAERDPKTMVSFVPMANLSEHQVTFQPVQEKALSEVAANYTYFEDNDVLLARVTPCFENGKAGVARGLMNGIGFGSSEFYVLRCGEQALPEYIYSCVMHPQFRDSGIAQMTGTGGLQRVPREFVENFRISLPPLATQQAIVAELEAEHAVVAANRELIGRFELKIESVMSRVWGDEGAASSEA